MTTLAWLLGKLGKRARLIRYGTLSESCDYCANNLGPFGEGFAPSHSGSERCRSGSLASGGGNSHCTCDTCF